MSIVIVTNFLHELFICFISPSFGEKIAFKDGNVSKLPDYPEPFQTVQKLSSAISRVTRKNFPDAQKLSSRQCRYADEVFGPLGNGGG